MFVYSSGLEQMTKTPALAAAKSVLGVAYDVVRSNQSLSDA